MADDALASRTWLSVEKKMWEVSRRKCWACLVTGRWLTLVCVGKMCGGEDFLKGTARGNGDDFRGCWTNDGLCSSRRQRIIEY